MRLPSGKITRGRSLFQAFLDISSNPYSGRIKDAIALEATWATDVRGQWSIENQLHCVKVGFRED